MVLEAIAKRRSVRRYTSQALTDEEVHTLLEAAMSAPSANDSRPWEFIVVTDPALRKQLSQTHQWSTMAADAPVVFVMCGDERRSIHWVEDASAATENLLIQAATMGLGGVWVALYPRQEREQKVRAALGIPDEIRPLCLVPVGHPASSPSPRTRYEERFVHHDRF
ncbi:MAG: nitroreductase family protein [Chloroflexota bacterium]